MDCSSSESFGFDTIRLKENNTRIQFDDTSSAGAFPTNDWQSRANASAAGGASFLGIVPGADFSGNPAATATVAFAEPFPAGTTYAVVLTAVTSDDKQTFTPNVLAKSESGFTATLGTGPSADLVEVGWLARPVGE